MVYVFCPGNCKTIDADSICAACPYVGINCAIREDIKSADFSFWKDDKYEYCLGVRGYIHTGILTDTFKAKVCTNCDSSFCKIKKKMEETGFSQDNLIKLNKNTEKKIQEFAKNEKDYLLKTVLACSSCGAYFNHGKSLDIFATKTTVRADLNKMHEFIQDSEIKCPFCNILLVEDIVLSRKTNMEIVQYVNKELAGKTPVGNILREKLKQLQTICKKPTTPISFVKLAVGRTNALVAESKKDKITLIQKISTFSLVQKLFEANVEIMVKEDCPAIVTNTIKMCRYYDKI